MAHVDRRSSVPLFLIAATLGGAIGASCSSESGGASGSKSSGAGAASGSGSTGGGGTGGVHSDYPCDGCPEFPPLGAPECDAATLGKPTVAYPLDGILLPPNMNVLEVQFVPPAGATLFEVDFQNGVTEVKVETKCAEVPDVRGGPSKGCGVTLSQDAWNDIANINRDGDPLHVSVRATKDGSCVATSADKVDVLFAKEDLKGGIYYWQSATFGGIGGKTGGIYSHDFGSFNPTPTPFMTAGDSGTCIGCHTLSRDGIRMAVMSDDPDADDEMGDVKMHIADVATRSFIAGAKGMSPGFQTFTHDHSKMVASTFKSGNLSFAVFDGNTGAALTSWTIPNGLAATHPNMSKDDKTLVYVVPQAGTISKAGDHHFFGGAIYASTFDAATNAIGAPELLLAPTGTVNYYYPDMSANVAFIVLDEAPEGDAFWHRKARVKLLHFPTANSAPLDLPALNASDAYGNSWPRWSPFVQTYKNHKLLWVTFSSNRDYGLHLGNKGFDNCYPPESPDYDQPQPLSKQGVGYENCAQPQIWMAAVLVDEGTTLDSGDRSFPAFWLPFQDVNAHNFSAQWVEQIPDMGGPDGGTCIPSGGVCGDTSTCCADVFCCDGLCQDPSACLK